MLLSVAALALIAVALLFACATLNPSGYRQRVMGPTLVATLASFLACGVWWLATTTAHAGLLAQLGLVETEASRAALAQLSRPALYLMTTSGIAGLFAWWLPDLIDQLGFSDRDEVEHAD